MQKREEQHEQAERQVPSNYSAACLALKFGHAQGAAPPGQSEDVLMRELLLALYMFSLL